MTDIPCANGRAGAPDLTNFMLKSLDIAWGSKGLPTCICHGKTLECQNQFYNEWRDLSQSGYRNLRNYVKCQISLDSAQRSLFTSMWPKARIFWNVDFNACYCRGRSIQITAMWNRRAVQKERWCFNEAITGRLTLPSQQVWSYNAES